MISFFRQKRQMTIYIAAAVMTAWFLFFKYLPVRQEIKNIEAASLDRQNIISEAIARAEQIPELRKQLAMLQTDLENYQANVPDNRDLGSFLQQMASLMNEYDLEEQLIEPGNEIEGEDLNCIPVVMKCKGRLPQLFEFYRSVQSMDRLIRVERIELVNDPAFEGQLTMHTKTLIFYRPNAKEG